MAERLRRLCGVEKVRLTNTGTEATMHALRIARAYTGREKYLKFEGQYHGLSDYFMYSTASTEAGSMGSRRSPIPVPASSGIPHAIGQYVVVLPFNDLERLEETIEARWGEHAAVFVEPIMGNVAGIMPNPGFLEKIRALCDRYGIMMVMDEVKTGFRVAKGGAQELFGVQASAKNAGFKDIATEVHGRQAGKPVTLRMDTWAWPHEAWGISGGKLLVASPPAIVARWLANRQLSIPGVWTPEQVVQGQPFFQELALRGAATQQTIKERYPA